MPTLLETLGVALLALTLPGTLYLALLTLAGSLPSRRHQGTPMPDRIAIVVPAHDEADGILRTLTNLLSIARQDGHADIIVIADNCSDDTAAIASQCGVRVLERHDPAKRGKGHALHHAFTSLLREDYAAFAVIDADSQAAENFISCLRYRFGTGAEILQTRYTVLNGSDSPRTRLAEIAMAGFNVLRPRGREWLGLSVGILGNGFALRREAIERVPYTATSVVEDLEYHLKLIAAGLRVEFADDTEVRGEMPDGQRGRDTQRARWEGGRLRMLIEHGPSLAGNVLRGQWRFLDPLADLLLPPLAYQFMAILLVLAALSGSPSPALFIGLASLSVVGLHVLAALHVGRLPWTHLRVLVRLPVYLLWKLRMILPTLATARRDSAWVRTDRTGT